MLDERSRPGSPVTCGFSRSEIEVTTVKHTWTIANFSFFTLGKTIDSPSFASDVNDGVVWRLGLNPEGSDTYSRAFISLFLVLESCASGKLVAKAKVSILNTDQRLTESLGSGEPKELRAGEDWGSREFVLRDTLVKENSGYLPNDVLTVTCEITYVAQAVTVGKSEPPAVDKDDSTQSVPSTILDELIRSSAYSDVVFVVAGRKFHAHRAVLAARSPYFRDVFNESRRELGTLRFEMHGLDAATLKDLLYFIYTGEAENPDNMANFLATIERHASLQQTRIADPPSGTSSEDESLGNGNVQIDFGAVMDGSLTLMEYFAALQLLNQSSV